MDKLLYLLTALTQAYQSIHWTAKGGLFYSTHLLFERLYNNVNDERDSVAEIALSCDITEDSFYPEVVLYEASKHLKDFPKSISEKVKYSIELEKQVLILLKDLNDSYASNLAVTNLLAGMAEKHQRDNLFLLKQNLKS